VIFGMLCGVCGFTQSEIGSMTMGQVIRYMRAIPELMPLVNAFYEKPKKELTGSAAIAALGAMGIKREG
jgi:hypothetical protein